MAVRVTVGVQLGVVVGVWVGGRVPVTVGVRVSETEEAMGLDVTQHNERAVTIVE